MKEDVSEPRFCHKTIRNKYKWGTRNGVFYFLGNVPSHINHALPLYRSIGGTFIVLSEEAFRYCKNFGVDVVCATDNDSLFLEFTDDEVAATINYLNRHASVVIYYEIYPIARSVRAKHIMLTHGNSFKEYYIEWRQRYMPYYDLFAGLGPIWEEATRKAGVPKSNIIEVGLARSDEVLIKRHKRQAKRRVYRALGISRKKSTVAYMPTWWGPTSVNDTGKEIIRELSEEYLVIFRPHPSTPKEVIDEYTAIIEDEKLNVFYLPEGNDLHISLNDILTAADVFIGDMSSVVLDALLADLPIIIAYGEGTRMQDKAIYTPMLPVITLYPSITHKTVSDINAIIQEAVRTGINPQAYSDTKKALFYGLDGDNVAVIKKVIKNV